MKKYIDVILPLFLQPLTYSVPDGWHEAISPGCRVIVAIKGKKKYTAIVKEIRDTIEPQTFKIMDIDGVIDTTPIVTPAQLRLWQWIADYYMCTMGEVYKAAIPSRLRPGSETVLIPAECDARTDGLTARERNIIDIINREKKISIQKIDAELKTKNLLPTINRLLDKRLIKIKEEVKQTGRTRTVTFVRLTAAWRGASADAIIASLTGQPKAIELVRRFFDLTSGHGDRNISRAALTDDKSRWLTRLKLLTGLGILETFRQETVQVTNDTCGIAPLNDLNDMQAKAFRQIKEAFATKNVCLLHGVTSSGKTELYIHLIAETISRGKQVLYMLPEIALTTQITSRLAHFFGDRQAVYHSRLTDTERMQIWRRQLGDKPYSLIIGARSSVFLPFADLGLVIVDEEHEPSFKQEEPAPRYHGRDTAIVMAHMAGAKTLLGTATPSVESYHNAMTGKYGLVRLTQRYNDIMMPEIVIADLKDAYKRKETEGQFSTLLIGKIKEALDSGRQVILFQNRRGFSPMMQCHNCGWVPRCTSCDVSMTYHKQTNTLTCHYCGRTIAVPSTCPACGEHKMDNRGFGTERIEEDICRLFPEASVMRLDIDSTKTRNAYNNILTDFAEHKIDILVGTQMISKGLDFDNVGVVGIINADNIINYPDFRSQERAFQIMSQVAGRAGRKGSRGLVVLQTFSPDMPVIRMVCGNDYESLYRDEIAERSLFHYPPFCRLIDIYVKHKSLQAAESIAARTGDMMRRVFGERVLGPDKPPVARIQALHIRRIMLRIESGLNINDAKHKLMRICEAAQNTGGHGSAIIYCDVDPY